jgi:hypothetical protein
MTQATQQQSETKDIRNIISRRSDLSTFIVHLTRDEDTQCAKEKLKSIIQSWTIQARSSFGAAKDKSQAGNSQKCVCFTETPLEYIYLMLENIEGRKYQFAPYGVAITKKLARKGGVNPVWYVDITPGHDWLMKPINDLISNLNGTFDQSPFSKITPFIEQMGSGANRETSQAYRKEFWWEREWRHQGDFLLPNHVLLICREEDFQEFENLSKNVNRSVNCIDPKWGLEQIIARLAGFDAGDIELF